MSTSSDNAAPSPAPAAVAAIDPTAYGMVADNLIRTDRANADPDLDELVAAAKAGTWRPIAAWFAAHPAQWELRGLMCMEVNSALGTDDAWLLSWLQEAPDDPAAWTFHCYWLIRLAWQIRTANTADKVAPEQWRAFFRVLTQVPAAAARVRQIDPADPGGLVVHLGVAGGLQIPNDEYKQLWAELQTIAPNLVGAHLSAIGYWLPKWSGSRELLAEFVDSTLAQSKPGTLLSLIRLKMIRELGSPDPEVKLKDFILTAEVQTAIDATLLDFAHADPAHPYYSRLSHWLAYFLHFSGRHEEAAEHFRLISGYCGSQPWRLYKDPKDGFVKARNHTLRRIQQPAG